MQDSEVEFNIMVFIKTLNKLGQLNKVMKAIVGDEVEAIIVETNIKNDPIEIILDNEDFHIEITNNIT